MANHDCTGAGGVERDDIAALMPKAWLHAHLAAAITPLRYLGGASLPRPARCRLRTMPGPRSGE
jgi:hypothetical protein